MTVDILSHMLFVVVLSPVLLGIIGKTKAFFSGRWGPPLMQPYFDLFKLMRKGCVYSSTTTWIFRMAPMISMAATLAATIVIPLGPLKAPIQFWGDMLLFAYLFAVVRFVTILAALDTGSSFEGMGSSREATFASLSEITLLLDLTILALLAKSLSLSDMLVGQMASSWPVAGPELLLVLGSFFLILLAENSRIPVDDPETHLELTMIHEVMVLDHGGVDLAYILYGKAIKLFLLGSIFISMIFPFQIKDIWQDTAMYLAGMSAFAVLIGVVESTMARLRMNRVVYLLLLAFIMSIFGLIVTLVRR